MYVDLPRGRVAAWLLVLFTLLYVASANGVLPYGDDVTMLQVTRALVDHGGVDIPPRATGAMRGSDGRYYCPYGIGQSLLGVPFYVTGRAAQEVLHTQVFTDRRGLEQSHATTYAVLMLGVLTSAATVALLYLTCTAIGFSQLAAVLAALSLGLGTFVWHYSRTFMSEPPSMLALLLGLYGLVRHSADRRIGWLVVSGGAVTLAVLLRVANAVAIAPLGLFLLWDCFRTRKPIWRFLVPVAVWSAAVFVGILVTATYNYLRFANVAETGYGAAAFEFTTPLWLGLRGLLLSPGKSIFVYAPILVAAIVGWVLSWRSRPAITATVAGVFAVFLVLYAKSHWWYGGGAWGPRYLVIVLPFLMIGVAGLVDRGLNRRGWVALAALAAISVFVQLSSVLIPYVSYAAEMNKTPELFHRMLWQPVASPVLVHSRALLLGQGPFDLAPIYYQSRQLAWFQLGAAAAALAVLLAGPLWARSAVGSLRTETLRRKA